MQKMCQIQKRTEFYHAPTDSMDINGRFVGLVWRSYRMGVVVLPQMLAHPNREVY